MEDGDEWEKVMFCTQRLVELDGTWETEARCRRRSLGFPHGGGGRAREVG